MLSIRSLAVGLVLAGAIAALCHHLPSDRPAADDGYDSVSRFCSRSTWESMQPIHRSMLHEIARQVADEGRARLAACWESDPQNAAAVEAFNNAISFGLSSTDFQQTSRWTATAMGAASFAQGTPLTLTYSFVPDGTSVPSGTGEPAGVSSLFAWLNGIYGSPAVWQQIFADAFASYSNLTGLSYVYEPNDDGAAMFGSQGVVGVRGDCRISAKPIDGNSNVLAYNFFPNTGDMVLDAFDSFFSNTTNNSRRLRNVIAHEHGHGIGMLHVCPANSTKLMEPFISTSYLGPQHDDIQNAQRHYGDANESNDNAATATNLGILAAGTHTVTNQSTDDNSDVDFFKFTVAGSFTAAVQLRPVGQTYNQGPQDSACNGGTAYNSLTVSNLGVELLDTNGTTVLASANTQPAGGIENIPATPLNPSGGTYFVRVFPDATNSIQLYDFDVILTPFNPPTFTVALVGGVPATIPAGQGHIVQFQVTNGTGSPDPAGAVLHYSIAGAAFASTTLVHQGSGLYQGTIPPAACFDDVRFYGEFAPLGGGAAVFNPFGAPAVSHMTEALGGLVTHFSDDMNTDMGWTVTDDAALTDGTWSRGIPVGGGLRGDPATDFDGSGAAWLTDNVAGNSDVDGGATTLTSPVFNLANFSDAQISYAFWYSNDFGSNPNQDIFLIQATNNGSTWTTVESYNANAGAWVTRSFRLSDVIAPTAMVQFRFIAQDLNPGSVVEAGVDAFKIEVCPTDSLSFCGAGLIGLLNGGPFDVLFVNGSAGGSARRVDIPLNQGYSIAMQDVPGQFTAMPFAIFGTLGIPGPNDGFLIHPFVGTMCFTPCPAAVGHPLLFTLTNNLGADPCGALVPSTPTPWAVGVPPAPFPYQFTIQPIVVAGGSAVWVGNGVIVNYGS